MSSPTAEEIQKLQAFHVLAPTGKTVELVSCHLPQSVLMHERPDNSEKEEMQFPPDPAPTTMDSKSIHSQSRRWPTRKLIYWSLAVIVVFFLAAGATSIWLFQPQPAPVLTSTAEIVEGRMTAQEVVNAEPLPVSETVALGQPGFSPETHDNVPLPVGGVYDPEEDLPPTKTEYEELLEEVKQKMQQNNDADLYLADQIEQLQKLVISLQTGQTIVAESHEKRMNELTRKIDAMSEPPTSEITPIPSTNSMDAPPFRLIAIDRWQNEWNAVIELNGKISMLAPQTTRAGWILLQISPQTRTALFRSRSGTEAQLTVDG